MEKNLHLFQPHPWHQLESLHHTERGLENAGWRTAHMHFVSFQDLSFRCSDTRAAPYFRGYQSCGVVVRNTVAVGSTALEGSGSNPLFGKFQNEQWCSSSMKVWRKRWGLMFSGLSWCTCTSELFGSKLSQCSEVSYRQQYCCRTMWSCVFVF